MPELLKFPKCDHVIGCLDTVEKGFQSLDNGDYYLKETLCRQINHLSNLLLCDDEEFDPADFFMARSKLIEALCWYCEATNDIDPEFSGVDPGVDE